MDQLDLSADNVHVCEVSVETARNIDIIEDEDGESVAAALDNAQAQVFTEAFGESYLVIKITP